MKKRAKKVEFDLKLTLPRISATPLRLALAFILVASIIGPTWDAITTAAKYRLTSATQKIVATPATTLLPQLKFDKSAQAYVFNSGSANVAGQSMQVGGSGYKATFSSDSSKGITIHDNTNDLSLSFTPLDKYLEAKDESGHIVYPADATSTQILYTVKANGVKEDVVLQQPSGDNAVLRYRLDLPNTLEARLLPSGDLGIYSADPNLLGNVQTGSTADQQLLNQARQNAKKDHLAFVVPAPIVKEAGHSGANPTAKFSLDGNILTVTADGLTGASYPLSIDPSFVVTSVNTFMYGGNGDDDITFDQTNNQISRAHLSGGNATSLTTGSIPQTMITQGVVVYNGYIYTLGGRSGGVDISTVYYAGINSDGSLNANTCGTGATWCTTTALPQTWRQGATVAYNGYIYTLGGTWNNGSPDSQVRYAKLNSNGTIASNSGCGSGWCTASNSLPITKSLEMAQAYNGIIYLLGGQDNGSSSSAGDSYYSVIKPDGTPGTWHGLNGLPTAVFSAASAVFDNTLYVMGGNNYNGSVVNVESTIQYARIQSDGSVSAWQDTTSLPVPLDDLAGGAGDGYLYTMGGCQSENTLGCQTLDANVRYAPINADGTIGAWQTATSTIGTARSGQIGAYYQGNLYTIGGCTAWSTVFNCSTTVSTVARNTITSAGATTAYSPTTSLPVASQNATTVVYNGYIYSIGGCTSGFCAGFSANVYYAPINSNGTLGAWTPTTSLTLATGEATSVAYNGYLYEIGGANTVGASATVSYAPINANGTLGSWSTTTALPLPTEQATSVVYDGYVYEIGGSTTAATATVDYAPINTNGTLGTWAATTSLPKALYWATSIVASGYLYEIGGQDANSPYASVYYASINNDGTLGAWSTTTSLPQVESQAMAAIDNGYIYEFGGCNSVQTLGCTAYSTVYSAPIQAGGGLGSWSSNTSYPTSTRLGSAVVANGYIYDLAGLQNGSLSAAVDYAQINNGGTGGVSWSSSTSTTGVTASQPAVTIYNGHLYRVGGFTGGASSTTLVQMGSFNSDGTVTWSTEPSTPAAAGCNGNQGYYASGLAAYANQLYMIGGATGNCGFGTQAVLRASIDPTTGHLKTNADNYTGGETCFNDGSGNFPWCGDKSLSNNGNSEFDYRAAFSLAQYGNAIYVIGGGPRDNNTENPFASYVFTTANSSPTSGYYLSNWTNVATNNMPSGRYYTATAQWQNYVYVIGGATQTANNGGSANNYGAISDVLYSQLNPTATDGTGMATPASCTPLTGTHWCKGPSLPFADWAQNAFVVDGFLTVTNGVMTNTGSIYTGTTVTAPILPQGSLEDWINVGSTISLDVAGCSYYSGNGKFYCVGGSTPGGMTNLEQHATVQAIPRIGHYTRLLDAGNDVIPYKLWLGGTSIGGSPTLDLQTSTSAADSLSTISTDSSVSLGLNSLTGLTAARYSFIRLTLDDSTAGVFPDDIGGSTAFSGLIYYFHPAPFNRLRGGSTLGPQGCNFNGGSTCQLDASP